MICLAMLAGNTLWPGIDRRAPRVFNQSPKIEQLLVNEKINDSDHLLRSKPSLHGLNKSIDNNDVSQGILHFLGCSC